jgi:site-specific DNA-methyltransferase (adenine-specific)
MRKVWFGEAVGAVERIENNSVDLIYLDPPFNTGKVMKRDTPLGIFSYSDIFKTPEEFYTFLKPIFYHCLRILKPTGSLYVHLDYREVHYIRVMLDGIFGRECFINEIVWVYDYGARSKTRWSAKHDNILYYVKDPTGPRTFNYDQLERIPYMAPGLCGKEKAERGKTITDSWWHTIVPTNGKEKTGYPTQKPIGIIKRIIAVSSRPGDLVVDLFAGSGTIGDACLQLDRQFILVDRNPQAIQVMQRRFKGKDVEFKRLKVI